MEPFGEDLMSLYPLQLPCTSQVKACYHTDTAIVADIVASSLPV